MPSALALAAAHATVKNGVFLIHTLGCSLVTNNYITPLGVLIKQPQRVLIILCYRVLWCGVRVLGKLTLGCYGVE